MSRPFLRPLLVWTLGGPYLALAVTTGFLFAPFIGRRKAFWLLAPGWIRQMAACFGLSVICFAVRIAPFHVKAPSVKSNQK